MRLVVRVNQRKSWRENVGVVCNCSDGIFLCFCEGDESENQRK